MTAIDLRVKRIYDLAEPGDGYRVLIDHVWPRGVSRERAQLDEWARELAPSDGLVSGLTTFPSGLGSSALAIGRSLPATLTRSRPCVRVRPRGR
jgi:hypothetical protein